MFPRKLTHQAISEPDFPVAETRYGRLRGTLVEGTFVFRGVPYAKAERFHMPEFPDSWEGIRDAVVFGPVCAEVSTLFPRDAFVTPHFWYPQSEHCHNLNIWTRHLDRNARRPVMIWIHGGGFQHGSAVELFAYDGEELAGFGDVVVVSVNHRLHALGYMDLSGYGDEYRSTGNLGTADLVKALEWVRDDIEAFGGDPGNVMVFGQSGGGGKLITLLQSPAADGLYHRGAIHSGVSSVQKLKQTSPERARLTARYVAEALGLTGENIKRIETIPFFKLAAAINRAAEKLKADTGERLWWGPVPDGAYYLGHPLTVGFREATKDIPLIIGSTLGEFDCQALDPLKDTYGSRLSWSDEVRTERLQRKFGDTWPALQEEFSSAYPTNNPVDVLYVDPDYRPGCLRFARLRAESGCAPIYCFLFALELPVYDGSFPWHNAEEAYVFHQSEYLEASYIPRVSEQLQDIMAGYWVAFAATGNPNCDGLPIWEAVKPGLVNTMVFDRGPVMRRGHDDRLMQLFLAQDVRGSGADGPRLGYGGGPRQQA
jgi:para-nitrobenzyl esterase